MNKHVPQLELVPTTAVAAKPNPAPVDPQPDDDLESSPFDWIKDQADIVLQEQPAIAVYTNPYSAVVIRQKRDYGEDDDVIYVRPENVPTLIAALKRLVP